MSSVLPVIFYCYDVSPYSAKIDNVLTLKNIPHQKVKVSRVLPRPEISDLLGITYRQIPILSIGNDVYCDTSLIASTLERRFPSTAGYGTIFPPSKHASNSIDTGAIKLFSRLYDATVFPNAASLLPWENFPQSFIDDRSKGLLEEQLNDGREWLFDSQLPSLADVSVHFILSWLKSAGIPAAQVVVAKYHKTALWFSRVSRHIKERRDTQAAPGIVSGHQAATTIVSAPHEPYDVTGFDKEEANLLGLQLNDIVQVAPDESGKNYPTIGKLVGYNTEKVVIEVQGSLGLIRCHFPRLKFAVTPIRLRSEL
ncbi:hypothetical protein H0H93_002357 [Arthromyces matolae]|nr:hypothetical protein H0H93_002357 [Arthromyces matolae]